MANETISPNMSLTIPGVGLTTGPQYATDINNCLTILDQHNHNIGSGVQINPTGININSDLQFNGNNATLLRTTRYSPQSAVLTLPADIGALYVNGVDLYYNDVNGNAIRLTQMGSIVGTAGSITGLPSGTASASYSTGTFIFQSASNTSANIDGGSFIFRNNTAGSNGVTVQPPNSIGSNYTLTLPILPSRTNIVALDSSGNLSATVGIGNLTPPATTSIVTMDTSGNLDASTPITVFTPPGAMMAFGGNSQPAGWLVCNGQPVSRTTFAALFSAIGTAYGAGDGSTTFRVPDFQGRFLRGVDGGTGRDPDAASRTAMNPGGNTGNNVGSVEGQATAINGLTLADPGHNHTQTYNNNISPGGTNVYADVMSSTSYSQANTGDITTNASTGITLTSTNSETRPINAYVNWIIKT